MPLRLITLIVIGYLAIAPLAKADNASVIYTFNSPGILSWSFDVPAIITDNSTTITSFLSTHVDPSSFLGSEGCAIDGASIDGPTTTNPSVSTFFSGCFTTGIGIGFFTPITSFGTFSHVFSNGDVTLTISPVTTPEPSGLLLLGAGFIGVFGMARRKSAGTAVREDHHRDHRG